MKNTDTAAVERSFELLHLLDLPLQDRCLQQIVPGCHNNLKNNFSHARNNWLDTFQIINPQKKSFTFIGGTIESGALNIKVWEPLI